MTRSTRDSQLAQAVSGETKHRAGARVVSAPASMQFLSFEANADEPAPLALAARRETVTVTDDLDAERWLDEGGSFSAEAVTRCPARR